MDKRAADKRLIGVRRRDSGFTSIQFLVASGLALVFFAALANLVVVQYARGAVRSALDQGARSGAIQRSTDVCEGRIGNVLSELLGGEIGETASYECRVTGGAMVAYANLTVDSWTPMTGDFDLSLEAAATLEPDV